MAVVTIYEAPAKIFEFASGKSQLATIFLVISGKNRFDNGGIYDNFELPFFARKIYQYGSTVYQKMQNYNIFSLVGGVSFLSKVHFVNIFMRRSLRLKWSYNLISKTLNISRLHLFVYCGPILIYFSG